MNFLSFFFEVEAEEMNTQTFRPCGKVSLPGNPYVLDVKTVRASGACNSADEDIVAIASDFSLYLVRMMGDGSLAPLSSVTECHSDRIAPISVDKASPFSFWTGSLDRSFKLWDSREQPCKATVSCKTGNLPISCISSSCDGQIVATGTEMVGEDSHILFWDRRNLGSPVLDFTECHQDDLTTISFHPSNPTVCFSAAVDGLICVFDLKEMDEEESLKRVLNCGSSVSQFNIFGPNDSYLSCLTHVETMSLWNWNDGDCLKDHGDTRKLVPSSDYAIGTHFNADDQNLYLFTGNQDGEIQINHVGLHEIRTLNVLSSGHSDIVRCLSVVNSEAPLIVSGSEDGTISLWWKQ